MFVNYISNLFNAINFYFRGKKMENIVFFICALSLCPSNLTNLNET